MQNFSELPPIGHPPPQKRSYALWWIVGGVIAVTVLGCGGLFSFVAYMGVYGPETSVYTGNRVPARFVSTMEDVGALEEGEKLLYFYSDALTDIRDGFYFVSDRKVVIYSQAAGGDPLIAIPFEEIEDAEIHRNESFIEDSEITLQLKDGQIVSFPVSSEYDRDQKFFDAIQDRISGQ